MRIVWTRTAQQQLRERARDIAADNPSAAVKWLTGARDSVARLADFPLAGRVIPELREDELREIIYGDYRILYRVGETAEVLAVRHGSLPLTSVDLDQD
ncbi:MAG: Plasmid stabilization system protein [Actinobacteria bacterium ADurb.BinA094]|nr:MAG: Plasmid stabilization system protein [Actinobacteria bacterium ADurb.BinA094]